MNFLTLTPLTADLLPAAVELDRLCLGGLWTPEGYQRELESPNSDLLILQHSEGREAEGGRQKAELERPSSQPQTKTLNPPLQHQSNTPNPPLLGLGCLWAILEEAHITLLAVHPAYQRQGFGQVLLCSLMTAAWQRRLEWVTLEVRVSNQNAIALYQKFGFREVGRRRKYYQDTGEDALILWYNGLQKPEFQETLRIWYTGICDRLSQSGWQLSKMFPELAISDFTLDLSPPS